jgi:hypothetical protein
MLSILGRAQISSEASDGIASGALRFAIDHHEIKKRRRLKLPDVAIETQGLGSGQRQHILELYDLPATVRIDDLEARKFATLFLDVNLARLVYDMI